MAILVTLVALLLLPFTTADVSIKFAFVNKRLEYNETFL